MEQEEAQHHHVQYTLEQMESEHQRYMVKVYAWMCFAMVITGAIAMFISSSKPMLDLIFGSHYIFFGLIILELISVGILVELTSKLKAFIASIMLIFYSILNGLTFSCIFTIYTEESIASTFFITAGTFAVMSVFGLVTKTDLTRGWNLILMSVVALVIAIAFNLIFDSTLLYWVTTLVGVLTFVCLTAYDSQKIKDTNVIGNEGTDDDQREAIVGALTLYIDLINLFLYVLRIFGRRK